MLARSIHTAVEPAKVPVEDPSSAPSCLNTSVEYLLLEMIRYYAQEQNHVAAVHAVETVGFQLGSQLAERCGQTCCGLCSKFALKAELTSRSWWQLMAATT